MKVMMFVNNLDVSGGYQKLVIRLAQNLNELGDDVIVCTPSLDKKNCYPDDIKKIKIISLHKSEQTGTLVDRYERLVRKIDPDFDYLVIHDELSLIAVALLPKKKTTWMLNNQLSDNVGKYKPEISSAFGQKHLTIKGRWADTKEAKRRVGLIRAGLKKIDHFATYDSFNKSLVKKFLGKEADIVYAGADLDQFKKLSRARKFSHKKTYQILSVGVVFPHRRYEDLIEATSLVNHKKNQIKTVVVGRKDLSEGYFKELKDQVKKLGIERQINFISYVTDQKMRELYSKSDAFVFINDGFTWGISVFEAVAANLPVVITNNIGAVDLIKQGRGWVVEPRSPKEVAKAIEEIITNREKARKITEKANKEISGFVSWREYTKRMQKLMKK